MSAKRVMKSERDRKSTSREEWSTSREQNPAKRTVINGRKQKNKVREEHRMMDSHAGNETTASFLHFTVFSAFILIFHNLIVISYVPFKSSISPGFLL